MSFTKSTVKTDNITELANKVKDQATALKIPTKSNLKINYTQLVVLGILEKPCEIREVDDVHLLTRCTRI